ncbi:MAG TPA: radical SAM protein [Terriglobia bacterium]|nr:radical SAM protein [Terriglobia bacterium]
MTDVLLTHSYHLYYDRKQVRKMQPYPPLGTLYAAALLRHRGFSVALFDSMLESPEETFAEVVARTRPRIVAIYEDNFNFLSKMCLSRMRNIAFGMMQAARAVGATVVVNGSDSSDRCAEYLQHGADYVLIGEAEWTLLELIDAIVGQSRLSIDEIQGLAYTGGGGSIVRTPARVLMKTLDALPFPARDLVDLNRYKAAWKLAHGFFALNLVASRGCPYKCNWCAKPIYGNSFNVRSPRSVAAEMVELRDLIGADFLWFADDLFGIRKEWVQELADHVEQLDAVIPFKMQSRVDLMQKDTVDALRRAGCAEVWMGVESGSQKILDAMDKGTRVSQIEAALETLKSSGIRACFFIQLGYPGETWEDIEKTIQLVRRTRPDDIGVSVSYPLPGTTFYERVSEQLGKKTNWEDSGDLSMMFKGAYTSDFYRALHDALHAEVTGWSSPWRFSTTDRSSDSLPPRDLWKIVDRLEETCRNTDPTEMTQWICS